MVSFPCLNDVTVFPVLDCLPSARVSAWSTWQTEYSRGIPLMQPHLQPLSFRPLQARRDERGVLTEVFRNEWLGPHSAPVQWNYVRSEPDALRGVHVHLLHVDYLIVLRGTMILGTCDLRENTPGFLESRLTELRGDELTIVTVPTGIAHGFYFPEATDMLYSVTHYWDPVHDELGCRWDDPELKLDWPVKSPLLSPRDREAPSLSELLQTMRKGNTSW